MTMPRFFLFALFFIVAALPARAQLDRVYGWETPGRGWLEPSVWTQVVAASDLDYDRFSAGAEREGLVLQTFELEYGLTGSFAVGAYADFEVASGEPLRYAQARVVARWALFSRYERFFDTALYAEYYQPRASYGEPSELEFRLILEKDLGDVRLRLNPIVSKATSGEEIRDGLEGAFAGGLYYRRFFHVQPGVEYYTSIGELADPTALEQQRHVVYPVVNVNLVPGLSWNIGAGFGLTDGSDDVTVKSILSYEFNTIRPANQRR